MFTLSFENGKTRVAKALYYFVKQNSIKFTLKIVLKSWYLVRLNLSLSLQKLDRRKIIVYVVHRSIDITDTHKHSSVKVNFRKVCFPIFNLLNSTDVFSSANSLLNIIIEVWCRFTSYLHKMQLYVLNCRLCCLTYVYVRVPEILLPIGLIVCNLIR